YCQKIFGTLDASIALRSISALCQHEYSLLSIAFASPLALDQWGTCCPACFARPCLSALFAFSVSIAPQEVRHGLCTVCHHQLRRRGRHDSQTWAVCQAGLERIVVGN